MSQLPRPFKEFKHDQPSLAEAYEALGATAAEAGPLEGKVRELVKLGMSAAIRSESAVHSHSHRALAAGATADEIQHAILLGVTTIGFPTTMAALTWAKAAIETRET